MTWRKKTETPSKQPENPIITHEEEEEMQHDISKLQDQVHQISLSQRGAKNEMDVLKKSMEDKMDGLNKGMESTMYGFKNGMC